MPAPAPARPRRDPVAIARGESAALGLDRLPTLRVSSPPEPARSSSARASARPSCRSSPTDSRSTSGRFTWPRPPPAAAPTRASPPAVCRSSTQGWHCFRSASRSAHCSRTRPGPTSRPTSCSVVGRGLHRRRPVRHLLGPRGRGAPGPTGRSIHPASRDGGCDRHVGSAAPTWPTRSWAFLDISRTSGCPTRSTAGFCTRPPGGRSCSPSIPRPCGRCRESSRWSSTARSWESWRRASTRP